MNKLKKMNYSILLMDWAHFKRRLPIEWLFVEFILVKRFSYILFLDKCTMNQANNLFDDEICQKKCKRGKMWRKMSNAAIFVVMRAVTLN